MLKDLCKNELIRHKTFVYRSKIYNNLIESPFLIYLKDIFDFLLSINGVENIKWLHAYESNVPNLTILLMCPGLLSPLNSLEYPHFSLYLLALKSFSSHSSENRNCIIHGALTSLSYTVCFFTDHIPLNPSNCSPETTIEGFRGQYNIGLM